MTVKDLIKWLSGIPENTVIRMCPSMKDRENTFFDIDAMCVTSHTVVLTGDQVEEE